MPTVTRSKKMDSRKPPFRGSEAIELLPQGVVIGVMENRPMLLLRSLDGAHTLPVWLNEVQMPIVLAEMGHNGGFDRTHGLTLKILKELGGSIETCLFVELAGVHQFVDVSGVNSRAGLASQRFTCRARADEAMGLVLAHKAKIFATRDYIESCRSLQMDSRDLPSEMFENVQKNSNRNLQ